MSASRLAAVPVVLLLLALSIGSSAGAASNSTLKRIYAQCQKGAVSSSYTQEDYADALRDIPADLREYTNCPAAIRTAQLQAARATDLRVSCHVVDRAADLRCAITQLRASSAEPRRTLRGSVRVQGRRATATRQSRGRVTVTLRGDRRLGAKARAVVDVRVLGTGERRRLVLPARGTRTIR